MKPQFLLLFCLFLTFSGYTQIVNIEDRRSEVGDTVLWLGNMNFGFNLVQNGDAVFTFHGSVNAQYLHHRHLLLSFTQFNLVRVDAQDFVNDGFQHFRYNYRLNDRLTWEAFTQAQYNEKIKLQLRGLLGTGLRLALLPLKHKHRAYLGSLYMYEYNEENETDELDTPFVVYRRDHRLSNYIACRFELGDNIVLANTSYYQPLINNFADLRLSSQTAFQIGITEKLRFNTTFTILYDSRVPTEVNNTIYSWKNGIRWEF